MKFLFDDESFSFETLRAAGFARDGGADLGEILSTAREIPDGDEDAWLRAWQATAERVGALGEASRAAGHRVSAREALLRASNYYRTAEFFRRAQPADDPLVKDLSQRSRAAFGAAIELFDTPVERVEIPYEGTTLPGYLFLADDTGAPRPTLVYVNGYDSTAEEAWFVVGASGVRRGYHVLAVDGPGQGAVLREQGLTFRPDWEAVVTPIVDVALTRPEIDPGAISLFGYSMGGYLVARAAAFEHRVSAIVLDDGVLDFHSAFDQAMPPFLTRWIDEGDPAAVPVMELMIATSTKIRWAMHNGMWTFGVDTPAELVRASRAYSIAEVADRITCPTLVLDAENDQFFRGQPQLVEKAITGAPTTLVTLTDAEGAGEHCHMGAMARFQQVMFDWLDGTR